MKMKTFFRFSFVFFIIFFILVILTFVSNQKDYSLKIEKNNLDFLQIIPSETENFISVKKEFLSSNENLKIFFASTINKETIEFLQKINTKEIIEFIFQDERFLFAKSSDSLSKYGSFYDFSPSRQALYFNKEQNLYFFKKNNFLIFHPKPQALNELLKYFDNSQNLYLKDNTELNQLFGSLKKEAVLFGFYKKSENFKITIPFIFNFDNDSLEIALISPNPNKANIDDHSFNFPNQIAEFSGKNFSSALQIFQNNFLEKNNLLEKLEQNYGLKLENIILEQNNYQIDLFADRNFIFLAPQKTNLEPIKDAWRLYIAELYPKEVEKILPDGTKAIHFVRDMSAFNFQTEEFFGIKIERLKKDNKDLIIAHLDPYLLITSNEELLKESMQQIKQKENLDFWLALKEKAKIKQGNFFLNWQIKSKELNKITPLKKEFLNFQRIEINGVKEDEILKLTAKFK